MSPSFLTRFSCLVIIEGIEYPHGWMLKEDVVLDLRRLAAFVVVIVVTLGVIAWSFPGIAKNVKLGLDLQGGFEILYKVEPLEEGQRLTTQNLREAAESLERRVNVTKVEEPEITPEGNERIRVRLAGVANQEAVRDILKRPAQLTFRSSIGCSSPTDYCNIELRGDEFKPNGASAEYEADTRMPVVAIELKDADKFYNLTKKLTRSRLAIFMDEELISDPAVNYPISGGKATITGQRTLDEARELASLINSGALPVKLSELYTQSVGATLGKQSLERTVQAGIIGTLLIFVFMAIVYRVPGMLSTVTLIANIWLLLLVLYWMKATLTLPGIAAFVLGIGMAVDANIITYERIKEELLSGKSLLSSIRAGSKSSFRTIMDANLTTILAAGVMYFVGTGAIQGFSITLIFSILVSILTNVYFSRLLLLLLVRSRVVQKPRYFGVKEANIREL